MAQCHYPIIFITGLSRDVKGCRDVGSVHSVNQACVFILPRGEVGKTTKVRVKNIFQKFGTWQMSPVSSPQLLPSLVTVCITSYPLAACTAHTPTHTLPDAHLHADRPFLCADLKAQCWEGPVAPTCQWHPGERAGKHAAVSEAVCHPFQGNQRLQEINPVENTRRDNDGKRQQSENVQLKWKPRCQVLIM